MRALISLFFLFNALFLTLYPQEKEYPGWFLYPALHPGIVTGFTYNSAPAIEHAAAISCIYKECILYGTLEVWNSGDIDRAYRKSGYYYYFSDKCANEYKTLLQPLDSELLNILKQDWITAFTTDSSLKVSGKRIRESDIAKPSWVELSHFEKDGWLYGVGTYTSTGSDNDAWITAEEKALFSIIQHQIVKIFSYTEIASSTRVRESYTKVVQSKVSARLRGIEVIERYPDFKEKLFYVLVRIPSNEITFLGDDFDIQTGFKKYKVKQDLK